MKLLDALRSLDPYDDMHWTKDGQPAMAALEALVADRKISREEVESITGGAKRPAPGETAPDFYRQPIPSPSRIVMVQITGELVPAIVSRVNADHSINVHVFPGEGASFPITGVKHKHALEQLPEGDAGRNVPYWEWPKRS